jgi:hypothetical protein
MSEVLENNMVKVSERSFELLSKFAELTGVQEEIRGHSKVWQLKSE